MKHLILGNGAAGISAAAKLRELCNDDEITIISAEDTPVYAKIMLPDYIGGKLVKQKLFLRNFEYYSSNRMNLSSGNGAISLDTDKKHVYLEDGSEFYYDKLLIAIGGVPFVPEVEGLNKSRFYTINSIKDAEKIKAAARPKGRAIITGAGLTGIEMGFALKKLGMEVQIVEREERVLPMLLDDYSSRVFLGELGKEGLNFILGRTIKRVETINNLNYIVLSDGEEIPYDMLIISIGTRPRIDIIKDTSIKTNKGILIDEFMQTSVKDIYAAGDVAEIFSEASGEYVSRYLWPNAMAQGKCAALGMAGKPERFSSEGNLLNMVQLRDIPFMSMGLVNPKGRDYETLHQYDEEQRIYKKLVLKDGVVKGMVFLGDVTAGNTIASLIRKGSNVAAFRDRLMERGFIFSTVMSK